MVSTTPTANVESDPPTDRCERALTEAIGALETIRDEGPAADPAYPTHGGIEAHDAWGFDSASHERAETARGTLADVEAIMKE